ncbi:MAG: hypothetical protein JWR69_1213 [Pedosphaera sp.]|nr:hypothetical protein [Pedosphaera sp.]
MKVLIQNTNTDQYLTNYGEWTTNPMEAEDFLGPARAWHFAKLSMPGDFRVLIFFTDSYSSVTLKEQQDVFEDCGMLLAA